MKEETLIEMLQLLMAAISAFIQLVIKILQGTQ